MAEMTVDSLNDADIFSIARKVVLKEDSAITAPLSLVQHF